MAGSSKQSEGLVEISALATGASSKIDALAEKVTDHSSRSDDTQVFRCNVVLEASALVDAQLPSLIDGSSETAIILAGIEVVGIVLRHVSRFHRLWGAAILTLGLSMCSSGL